MAKIFAILFQWQTIIPVKSVHGIIHVKTCLSTLISASLAKVSTISFPITFECPGNPNINRYVSLWLRHSIAVIGRFVSPYIR